MPISPKRPRKKVVVIGGGPAGMLAAATAAEQGAQVILLERNNRLGKKLALTGQGRCNFTNSDPDLNSFITAYGKYGKFLYSALTAFSNRDTIQLFKSLGVITKTEADGRVFPKSDKATDVITALSLYLARQKVNIEYNHRVTAIIVHKNQVCGVVTEDQHEYQSDTVILATGGKSYPQTGSTGDGYQLVEQLGITLNPPSAALVPLEIVEPWIKRLQGVSVPNIKLTIATPHRTVGQYYGDLIFTHYGISGPVVLDSSDSIGKLLTKGQVVISLDLLPQFTESQLDIYFQHYFRKHPSQQLHNIALDFLPNKLIIILFQHMGLKPDKLVNQLTKPERQLFIKTIKNLILTVKRLRSIDEAMVTAGGIALSEINSKTMEAKQIHGLYFAGEIIDLIGKSGGYNLQMAFSTGYMAGLNSAILSG
ncbi:MAG: NAD(P)/FAD-dependent oxidoreductase [bacterium]